MKFLRSCLVVFSFTLFGVGSLLVGFFVFPLIKFFVKGETSRYDCFSKTVHSSWKIFVAFLQLVKVLRLDIEDYEKIKNIKNSLIVSTHPSYIDVLILLALVPKTTCFVAPRLTENKFFKKIVESMFLISGKSLEEICQDTEKMFDNGFNVLIFPSGIRHRKDEQPKIRKGASMVALHSKKNIVPIIMHTDFDFLQIGQPFYDAGTKPVTYSISCLDSINIESLLNIQDEIEQKKKLTDEIKKSLYKL